MKILNPPIKLCSEILEFLYEFHSRKKDCTAEILKNHFHVAVSYFDRAILFLGNHSLIEHPRKEIITLSAKATKELQKSPENSRGLILERLLEVQPFIEFTYFLGKGKNEAESVKLVTSLYDISQDENLVLKIFKEWIKLLGVTIPEKLSKNKTLDGIKDSIQNKLYANNFVKEFLGSELHNVSEPTVAKLSEAIKQIPEDNESSVNEAGRALEDFLRIDLAKDVDLTGCSGIGEIGNELNKHDQYPKKLNNLCVGLTNVRSMGKAHGSDKSLKAEWVITEHGAIGYIIMILSLLKSYLVFKQESKPIF